MNWYESWFNRDYLTVYAHRSTEAAALEVQNLVRLLPPAALSEVLDVACGTGRHLVPLSRFANNSWGVDLSETLLSEARNYAAQENSRAQFVKADMRKLPFSDNSFSLVCSLFTSFGYFETDLENENVLREWFRILKSAGYIVLDFMNKDHVLINLQKTTSRTHFGTKVEEVRSVSPDGLRIEKQIIFRGGELDGREYFESVRLYDKSEMLNLLHKCGLKNIRLFGSFSGEEFVEEKSERLLLISQKN